MKAISRQEIIDHAVSILSLLPVEKAVEVGLFADFIKQRYEQEIANSSEAVNEIQDWQKTAATWMAKAYSDDEPDYSDAPLLEVNPHFRPR